jgi:hypothetical protein
MNHDDMLRLFETHREAEVARDFDTLCEQAGLDVSEIRAAAEARAAGGSSGLS